MLNVRLLSRGWMQNSGAELLRYAGDVLREVVREFQRCIQERHMRSSVARGDSFVGKRTLRPLTTSVLRARATRPSTSDVRGRKVRSCKFGSASATSLSDKTRPGLLRQDVEGEVDQVWKKPPQLKQLQPVQGNNGVGFPGAPLLRRTSLWRLGQTGASQSNFPHSGNPVTSKYSRDLLRSIKSLNIVGGPSPYGLQEPTNSLN